MPFAPTRIKWENVRNYGVPVVSWPSVPGSESAHLNDDEQDWIRNHARG